MTGPAQPIEWYLARDNKQYGPLSDVELMKLVELRHLSEDDLLWRAGFSDWTPAPEAFPQAFPAPEGIAPSAAPAPEPEPQVQQAPDPDPRPAPEPAAVAPQPAAIAASEPAEAEPIYQPQPAPRTESYQPGPYAQAVQAAAVQRSASGTYAQQPLAAAPAPQPAGSAYAAKPAPSEQSQPRLRIDPLPAPSGAGGPEHDGSLQAGPAYARMDFGANRSRLGAADSGERSRVPLNGAHQPRQMNGFQQEPSRLDLSVDPDRGSAGRAEARQQWRGPAALSVEPSTRGAIATPALADDGADEDEGYEPPRKKRRVGGLVAVMVLLAAVVGGAWYAYTNVPVLQQSLGAVVGSASQSDAGPVVPAAPKDGKAALADPAIKRAAFAAANTLAASTLQNFPDSPAAIDQLLQAGYLWQVVRAEFPEWYDERVRETARMVAEKRPDEAITKHLVDSLVLLRRKNSDHAFSASLAKLQMVARRFRDSLDTLNNHSSVACFTLITNGEGTKGMVTLFRDPSYGPALQAGLAAVFEAIAEGRKNPATNLPPRRADYDALTKELKALGWDDRDVGMFADPDELAKAPPERVCKMVREWFSAHLAVPDADAQSRLLVQSVRPVVAG